jgi:hypothetical protein
MRGQILDQRRRKPGLFFVRSRAGFAFLLRGGAFGFGILRAQTASVDFKLAVIANGKDAAGFRFLLAGEAFLVVVEIAGGA